MESDRFVIPDAVLKSQPTRVGGRCQIEPDEDEGGLIYGK